MPVRSPFAGCLCATGSSPICPADRHLTPDPPEARRDRARTLERIDALLLDARVRRYVWPDGEPVSREEMRGVRIG